MMFQSLLFLSVITTTKAARTTILRRMTSNKVPSCIRTLEDVQKILRGRPVNVGDEYPFCRGESDATFPVISENADGIMVTCNNGVCTVMESTNEELSQENDPVAFSDDDDDEDESTVVNSSTTGNNGVDPEGTGPSSASNESTASKIPISLIASSGAALVFAILLAAIICRRRRLNSQPKKGVCTDEETSQESNEHRQPPVPEIRTVPAQEDPSVCVSTWTVGGQSELTMEGYSVVTGASIPSTDGHGFSLTGDEESVLAVSLNADEHVSVDPNIVTRDVVVPPGRLGIQVKDSAQGPIVNSVRRDGPLADIVFEGDIILKVNDQDSVSAAIVSRLLDQSQHVHRKLRLQSHMDSFVEE